MKTFTVSVSRMARGKAGYLRDKYKFSWSFYPEQHTIESLIELAAVDGYSFLAGEFDRKPPSYYGRKDATTARITENFRQTCLIPLDDDGAAGNAVDFWQSDKLFNLHGAGFYHSSSSTPERPRVRPIFELDRPITGPALYQDIRRAFGWYYPRIDPLIQVPQVFYGSDPPTDYRILGNVLPLETLLELVLMPYRKVRAAEIEERRRQAEQYRATGDSEDIAKILAWLASRQSGDNRNLCLLWVGSQLKKLGESWATVGNQVVEACRANGYYGTFAQDDREIERIFTRSRVL